MASPDFHENQMVQRAKQELKKATDPLEKLKLHCLQKGVSGIRDFGRLFRLWDEDAERKLSFDKFVHGLDEFGANLSPEEAKQLFDWLDTDGSGNINFDELLIALRPKMSEERLVLIHAAFRKINKTGSGVITVDDLKGVYNAQHHPDFLNGTKSEEEILHRFLRSFEPPGAADGDKVTMEEFEHYYAGVSASIDSDVYFDLMMRQAWKL